MPCHRGPKSHIGRIFVTYFADQYDVRVLAHHRPDAVGEIHSRDLVHRGLPDHINRVFHRVFNGDDEIELTTYEYKVFEYLLMHPGEVVTKTVLSEHIYEEDADRDSNVIEVFVGRLRRKIDPQGDLSPIETLRGRGYRLNSPSSTD